MLGEDDPASRDAQAIAALGLAEVGGDGQHLAVVDRPLARAWRLAQCTPRALPARALRFPRCTPRALPARALRLPSTPRALRPAVCGRLVARVRLGG